MTQSGHADLTDYGAVWVGFGVFLAVGIHVDDSHLFCGRIHDLSYLIFNSRARVKNGFVSGLFRLTRWFGVGELANLTRF